MSDNRNIYQWLLRYIGYLIFSLSFGVIVTLIVSNMENIVQEKKIKEETKKEIRNIANSYKHSVKEANSDKIVVFLKNYINSVMEDKLVAVDTADGGRLNDSNLKFLFTFTDEQEKIDIYMKKIYLKKTVYAIDPPDLVEGFIVTLIVLTSIILYSERKRQTLAIRKRYETETAELTRSLQKHEALALLGRMTTTLAHELKTPIATISNLIHTLPSRITDEKFTKRFMAITKEELSRTQQLIDNLLIYGKEIPDITNDEWINFDSFAGELANIIGIKILSCPKFYIYGDKFYLRLLFENIMRNSIQAGSSEATIKVNVPALKDEQLTEILFEDNGIGFPKDTDLSELINPFVTSRSRGAGLGLFLVQKIVLAHGGMITLCQLAQGAGVKISLPSKRIRFNE